MYYEVLILDIMLVRDGYLKIKIFGVMDEDDTRERTNNFEIEEVNKYVDNIVIFNIKGRDDNIKQLIKDKIGLYLKDHFSLSEDTTSEICLHIMNIFNKLKEENSYRYTFIVEGITESIINKNLELKEEISNLFRDELYGMISDKILLYQFKEKMTLILKKYKLELYPVIEVLINGINLKFSNKPKDIKFMTYIEDKDNEVYIPRISNIDPKSQDPQYK